jgi:hypothetical protein
MKKVAKVLHMSNGELWKLASLFSKDEMIVVKDRQVEVHELPCVTKAMKMSWCFI